MFATVYDEILQITMEKIGKTTLKWDIECKFYSYIFTVINGLDDHKHGGKVHVKGGVWKVGERLILAFVFFFLLLNKIGIFPFV